MPDTTSTADPPTTDRGVAGVEPVAIRVTIAGGEPYVAIDTGTRHAPGNDAVGVDAEAARAIVDALQEGQLCLRTSTSGTSTRAIRWPGRRPVSRRRCRLLSRTPGSGSCAHCVSSNGTQYRLAAGGTVVGPEHESDDGNPEFE